VALSYASGVRVKYISHSSTSYKTVRTTSLQAQNVQSVQEHTAFDRSPALQQRYEQKCLTFQNHIRFGPASPPLLLDPAAPSQLVTYSYLS
jgi:hypothetical protein